MYFKIQNLIAVVAYFSFLRFEVTAGLSALKDEANPGGIFNHKDERGWFDVGKDNWALLNFTQRHGKFL